MTRFLTFAIAFFAIASGSLTSSLLTADEGMIPISQIDQLDLSRFGLALTPHEIFNPNATCLVDGICQVNGCTGSFVSSQGLIITNHHCAFGAIQSSSSAEQDFLTQGFQAKKSGDEIQAKGYTVRITESYSDISQQVLEAANANMTYLDRTKSLERRRKELEKKAEQDNPGMRAEVAEMFSGKTYVLFLYTYLKDVRLVFAPPVSVGNFGGEIDNWEWPRHTGDFSFMRAYTAPDGSSADYSQDNIPYRPKTFIQVAPQGIDEGDFVFILGYPGKTARHKTASFLLYEQQVRLPFLVDLYGWRISTLEQAGKYDRNIAIQHASQVRSLANVEKRARGQLKGLQRTTIVQTRLAEEERLQKYIHDDPQRATKYGSTLGKIDQVYRSMTQASAFELNLENLISASRSLHIAHTLVDAAVERKKADLDRETTYMDRNFDQTKKALSLVAKDLHLPTDKQMLMGMLDRLASIAEARHLPGLRDLFGTSESMATILDAKLLATRLNDIAFVEKCLEMTLDQLQETGDPMIHWIIQLYPEYVQLRQANKARAGELDQAYGSLVEIKQELLSKNFVPDANSTLRLTYGHVRGYSPEDGVIKTPITTLKGVLEKTTGVEPFITPDRIRVLYESKDFGPFQHPKLKQVPVAILYDTDTTGGNSGSPVLNAKGQLIGVNFDRAFEATINDFAWNSDYSRSIGVDIRYCLWITGKVYEANHLLKEMGVEPD